MPILKKNILNLNSQDNSLIIEIDIINNLNFKVFKRKFDIIFMDPPYKEKNLTNLLAKIIEFNILNDDGIIIIHRHKSEKDVFPKQFEIIEERRYGVSKIIFGSYH